MSPAIQIAPRALVVRAIFFFLFWLILAGIKPADLVVGALAAMSATWLSVRLMPPGVWRFRPIKLAQYALRFLRQSLTAGLDVAWRALDPRMPLQPGFVTYQPQLSEGPTLAAFCTVSSLLPGTLPSGADATGGLAIHCLDVTRPMAEQLAAEEMLLADALGERAGHG